jgi:hypothetical protein
MLSKPVPYGVAFPEPGRARHFAAVVLHGASLLLGRLARKLLAAEPVRRGEPVLEFYAEAGAPEGALYLDGQLVGHLAGVSRL